LMRSVQGDAREGPARSRYSTAIAAGINGEDMRRPPSQ
jgi:hypothetical protein